MAVGGVAVLRVTNCRTARATHFAYRRRQRAGGRAHYTDRTDGLNQEGAGGESMQSSYAIDTTEQLVRLKVWGELTVDGLIRLAQEAAADPRFIVGMPAIADFREAVGDWDYSDIQRFRDYVAQVDTPPVRWAAIMRQGALVAVAHVLIVISEAVGAHITIKLFDDPDAASRWVHGEVE